MFEVGDILIRKTAIALSLPVGTIVRVKRVVHPGQFGSVEVEGLDGHRYGSGIYSTDTFEKQPSTLEERLSQARAEVARIEAEIAEAAKPKVGET